MVSLCINTCVCVDKNFLLCYNCISLNTKQKQLKCVLTCLGRCNIIEWYKKMHVLKKYYLCSLLGTYTYCKPEECVTSSTENVIKNNLCN